MTDAGAGHLDLDALADVLAGERPDDAHLRSCGACADRLGELADAQDAVAAALAALPSAALPPDLAERLAAALRDEAGRRGAPRTEPAAPVVPLRRRLPAWLPAVAASLVLVLAGIVGVTALRGPGSGAQTATSAAGGDSAERSVDGSADPGEAADETADSGSAGATLAGPGPVRSATGTDWADPDLRAAAVPRVLAGTVAAPSAQSAPGIAARASDPLDPLRDATVLAACVAALPSAPTPATQTLAVDYALHAGAPALAVVQRDDDPAGLIVTVVDPGCGPGDPELLLRTRVPPP